MVCENASEQANTQSAKKNLDEPGLELPHLGLAEGRGVDTTRNENGGGGLLNGFKGTLDSVKNVLHNAGAELNGKRLSGPEHWVSHSQTGFDPRRAGH